MLKVRRDDIYKVKAEMVILPSFLHPSKLNAENPIYDSREKEESRTSDNYMFGPGEYFILQKVLTKPFNYALYTSHPYYLDKDNLETSLASFYIDIAHIAEEFDISDIAIPLFYKLVNIPLDDFLDMSCSILNNIGDIYNMTFTLVSKNVDDFHKLREAYHKVLPKKVEINEIAPDSYIVVHDNLNNVDGANRIHERYCLKHKSISYIFEDPVTHQRVETWSKANIDIDVLFEEFYRFLENVIKGNKDKVVDPKESRCKIEFGVANEKNARRHYFSCCLDNLDHNIRDYLTRILELSKNIKTDSVIKSQSFTNARDFEFNISENILSILTFQPTLENGYDYLFMCGNNSKKDVYYPVFGTSTQQLLSFADKIRNNLQDILQIQTWDDLNPNLQELHINNKYLLVIPLVGFRLAIVDYYFYEQHRDMFVGTPQDIYCRAMEYFANHTDVLNRPLLEYYRYFKHCAEYQLRDNLPKGKKEEDQVKFLIPNANTIPCRTCKHKCFGILELYCEVYKIKPHDVYYESEPCPKYEEK